MRVAALNYSLTILCSAFYSFYKGTEGFCMFTTLFGSP